MVSFLRYGAFYIALLGLLAVPVVAVAHRSGRRRTIRRFLVAAAVAGTFCGFERAMTDRLEGQCRASGNTQCVDYGGSGMIYLVVVVFLCTSLTRAYLIHRD